MDELISNSEFLKKKPVTSLVDKNELPMLKKVGEKMGVDVGILANEGETYNVRSSGYTGIVPEGKVRVSISKGSSKDLGAFWEEVRKLQSTEQ